MQAMRVCPYAAAAAAWADSRTELLCSALQSAVCPMQSMFLSQLPRCHAVIPNFPVTGREASLSWQQRLQARAAQYYWHAPAERFDGSEPSFLHWDGNPDDPINFPIAYSKRPAQAAEAAAASLVRALLLPSSRYVSGSNAFHALKYRQASGFWQRFIRLSALPLILSAIKLDASLTLHSTVLSIVLLTVFR